MTSNPINNRLFKFGVTVFFLLLSACVTTQQDMLYMNDQVVALNSRVNKLEESIGPKLSTEVDSKLNSVRDTQAELVAEIDKMKGEIRGLSGRVEDNKRLAKHSIERDTTEQDTIKASLSELTQRLSLLETQLKQVQAQLGIKATVDMSEQLARKTPSVAEKPPAQPPVIKESSTLSEDQLYESTLATFKGAEYEEALVGFRRFVEQYPRSDLADNAQFWIGECYMGLKQYEQAILAYQEVIKKYPKGNKVPNAMLRQALAFYEIDDKISSRLLLKKIIREYPNSSEAKIASSKLKTFN